MDSKLIDGKFVGISIPHEKAANKENAGAHSSNDVLFAVVWPENQALFDMTFQVLYQQCHNSGTGGVATTTKTTSVTSAARSTTSDKTRAKGKEKQQWHNCNAKVTKEATAELDKNKP
jgi:hypothetical protein